MLGVDVGEKKWVYWNLKDTYNCHISVLGKCVNWGIIHRDREFANDEYSKLENPLGIKSWYSTKVYFSLFLVFHRFFILEVGTEMPFPLMSKDQSSFQGAHRIISLSLVDIFSAENHEVCVYLDTTSSIHCSHSSPVSLQLYKARSADTTFPLNITFKF